MTKLNPDETYRNKEWLAEQYSNNKKSGKEIAEECGVCYTTIHKYVVRYDIEHRGSGNRVKDLEGQRFGRLVVIGTEGKRRGSRFVWLCRCDCGNTVSVSAVNLCSGHTRSCGCLKSELSSKRAWKLRENNTADMVGQRFGRWLVLRQATNPSPETRRGAFWLCECTCGTTKIVRGDVLKSGDSQSCGCLQKEIVSKQCGENSPNWNLDKTDEEREKERSYPEYRKWRKSIFERDEYTCQNCGQKGGRLNAHHIESYNINKDLRTTLENGITLCKDCHSNFHHIYGSGNNTREQFDEFMLMENK